MRDIERKGGEGGSRKKTQLGSVKGIKGREGKETQ